MVVVQMKQKLKVELVVQVVVENLMVQLEVIQNLEMQQLQFY